MEKDKSTPGKWLSTLTCGISIKWISILILIWIGLVVFYRLLLFPLGLDVPKWFPVSVLYENGIHVEGLIYFIPFALLLSLMLWKIKKINEWIVAFGCFLLILFGNLMQGGFKKAFILPFTHENQYFFEALNVPHWREWLANFNTNQHLLNIHSKTHPPFAVLLHDVFLVLFNFEINNLAIAFSIISLITIPILLIIFRLYGVKIHKRKLLLLLFSVIPAINIYSIICLDGVIMTASTIFLLGLVILLRKPDFKLLGYLLMVSGLLLANFLSFGGVYLFGVGFLAIVFDIIANKRKVVLVGFILCIISFFTFIWIFNNYFHYSHIQSFIIASKLENPNGFRLFANPVNYLLTRFEDFAEIAFFLSFGVISAILSKKLFCVSNNSLFSNNPKALVWIGFLPLILMFLTGAFRTGETARACMYIYPYIFLSFWEIKEFDLTILIIFASIQTVIMQLCFGFFW